MGIVHVGSRPGVSPHKENGGTGVRPKRVVLGDAPANKGSKRWAGHGCAAGCTLACGSCSRKRRAGAPLPAVRQLRSCPGSRRLPCPTPGSSTSRRPVRLACGRGTLCMGREGREGRGWVRIVCPQQKGRPGMGPTAQKAYARRDTHRQDTSRSPRAAQATCAARRLSCPTLCRRTPRVGPGATNRHSQQQSTTNGPLTTTNCHRPPQTGHSPVGPPLEYRHRRVCQKCAAVGVAGRRGAVIQRHLALHRGAGGAGGAARGGHLPHPNHAVLAGCRAGYKQAPPGRSTKTRCARDQGDVDSDRGGGAKPATLFRLPSMKGPRRNKPRQKVCKRYACRTQDASAVQRSQPWRQVDTPTGGPCPTGRDPEA